MCNTKKFLHEYAKVEMLDWVAVRAEFYIDGSLEQVITIPRAKVIPGKNLYDDVERSNGWTSWGNVIVEAVDDESVTTSLGTITKTSEVSETYSNVMPYANGEAKISLICDYARVTIATADGKPERSFLINPDDYEAAMRGNLKGIEKMIEALSAQLPNEEDLIMPYMEMAEQIEKMHKWVGMEISADITGLEDVGPHVRIEAFIPRSCFERIYRKTDDKYDHNVRPFTPHCEATIWDFYNVDDAGVVHPSEFKGTYNYYISRVCPTIYFSAPQPKEMYVEFNLFDNFMTAALEKVMQTGIPQEVSAEDKGVTVTIRLMLTDTVPAKKTALSKALDKIAQTEDKDAMTDLSYDIKHFDQPEQRYELAMWMLTKQGRAGLERLKEVLGSTNLDSVMKILDNLRWKGLPQEANIHRTYGELLEAEGDVSKAKYSYREAAKYYEQAGNLELAEKMKAKGEE